MNDNLTWSKITFFGLILLLIFSSCDTNTSKKKPVTNDIQIRDYAGVWEGTLEISRLGKAWQSINMKLTITTMQDSTFDWLIEYNEKDKRPYVLKKGPKGQTHWIMDERNGIFLDCFLNDKTLGSMFEVQGTLLICDYTFNEDHIDFIIRASNTKEFTTSGNTINGKDTTPLTHSYIFPMYQHAVLKRKK